MNRTAIALAADSATTVTHWVKGDPQRRFFKGANKIFQVSDHEPVGLMLYGSATLHHAPWEILIKDFRRHLGRKSFNDLEGYASELFDFISNHGALFPEEFQRDLFKEKALIAATVHLFAEAMADDVIKNLEGNEQKNAIKAFFDRRLHDMEQIPLSDHFTLEEYEGAFGTHLPEIKERVTESLEAVSLTDIVDVEQLAKLAISSVIKQYDKFLDETGIVIAGYGDHDYFPGFQQYKCLGLLLGKIIVDHLDAQNINYKKNSVIKPFATTAMVYTFLIRFSEDVFVNVRSELKACLQEFAEGIKDDLNLAEIPNVEHRIDSLIAKHTGNWTQTLFDEHMAPMRRVVGELPVEEWQNLQRP